jgi:hypothetical protein
MNRGEYGLGLVWSPYSVKEYSRKELISVFSGTLRGACKKSESKTKDKTKEKEKLFKSFRRASELFIQA